MAWANLKLAVRNKVIEWPTDLPPMYWPSVKQIPLTRQSMLPRKIDLVAQANAKRRDTAFMKNVRKTAVVTAIYTRKAAQSLTTSLRLSQEEKTTTQNPAPVDIAGISGPAFSLNLRRKGNVCFTTSLYEIDRLLEDRKADEELLQRSALANAAATLVCSMDKYTEDEERVKWTVPDYYRSFTDVFSKQASDELPPFRPQVDHKIELTSENTLGHSPLYC